MNIKTILSKMSLADKIALCSGADFWCTKAFSQHEIPALRVALAKVGLMRL